MSEVRDDLGRVWELHGKHAQLVSVPGNIDERVLEREQRTAKTTAESLARVKAWREAGCPPVGPGTPW